MKRALIMAAGLWMIAMHFYAPRTAQTLSASRAAAEAEKAATPVLIAHMDLQKSE